MPARSMVVAAVRIFSNISVAFVDHAFLRWSYRALVASKASFW